jgi:uncharacterized protein (TIGR02231 family)
MSASVPVALVTVLEDRAHVQRRATLRLEPGEHRLLIEGASPLLSDKTLLARLPEASGAKVLDARVVRRALVMGAGDGAPAESIDGLRRELERLEDDLALLEGERDLYQRQHEALRGVGRLTLSELAHDVAWSKLMRAGAADDIAAVAARRRALCREGIELEHRITRQRTTVGHLQKRIEALDSPATGAAADLAIDLCVERSGDYALVVEYMVPNACWRPYHRARLVEGEEATITFETEACVWQRTGEAWEGVTLVLSTERASLGSAPPELASDVIRVQRKREALVVEAREQRIEQAGVEGGEATTPKLMGIDDGGEPQRHESRDRATIPSDGRPHRVPLGAFEVAGVASLESVPELSASVQLCTVQPNGGAMPILAGPVDLIRAGGLAGRTSVLYVARGERFELAWGPEPELRVSRRVEREKEEANFIGTWVGHKHHVEVRLSNLGTSERRVHVRERVPVSEIDKVRIEPHPEQTSERRTPDADGFVDWQVTVTRHGTAAIDLCYTLRRHSDVVGL